MTRQYDNLEVIRELLIRLESPPTVGELADALNDHLEVTHLDGAWVARQIERSAGTLEIVDGTVRTVETPDAPRTPREPAGTGRPLRAVAIDFETLPRHRDDGTLERVPLQAGGLRFGHDADWCEQHPPVERLVAADVRLCEHHPDHALLARAAADGTPPAEVGEALAALLDGADVVVGYNGYEVDFPTLDALLAAAQRPELARLAVEPVDAFYLAHAVLPDRQMLEINGQRSSAHTIEAVSHRLGTPVVQAHTALADARLLAEVCGQLAARHASRPQPARLLLEAATRTSHAWALLSDLAAPGRTRTPLTAAEARAGLDVLLDHLPHLRGYDDAGPDDGRGEDAGPAVLHIPDALRTDGVVDPYALARGLRPDATRRRAQDETAAHVRAAVGARQDALLEAPTGSGKSLVLLAAALDWVAAGHNRRAVISTYTKQLQSQLATTIEGLAGSLPGLAEHVDLVKGSANRLSLRALSSAAVALATGAPHRAGISRQRAADPAFQELVAYLVLRLAELSESSLISSQWHARSVDPDDLPAAFALFTGGRLGGLLADVSQARAGDYQPGDDNTLAAMTVKVREALQRRRIIIANHALLFSASSVFESLAEDHELLLLADEAHELEHAATSTMSATFGVRDIERLGGDLVALAASVDRLRDPADDGTDPPGHAFVDAVRRIDEVLTSEHLVHTIAASFRYRSGADVQLTRRQQQVIVAEADSDLGQLQLAARLEPLLRLFTGLLSATAATYDEAAALLPPDRADEAATIKARLLDTLAAVSAVAADLAELTGPPATPGDSDAAEPDAGELPGIDELEADQAPAGCASNRLVWAAEEAFGRQELREFIDSGMSLRHWPVTVTTTPIQVSDDPRFQRFRDAFAVSVFVSGTLRVPGADNPWQFIVDRLGLLGADTQMVTSDFDPARQAQLVAFSDFPSWGEQAKAAVATCAWQVDRFAREVITDDGRFGAMVLTTSRAAAGQIATELGQLRRPTDHHAIHDTGLVGNARALENFHTDGGVLVGTRGLWQGVDVEADRVRLVWVNKLPFPPVGDPIVDIRRARVEKHAAEDGHADPAQAASERFYLPLAAMALRQAVGRLLRSTRHRGIVIVSDPKLSGEVRLRRTYRRFFLASLDGYALPDPDTGELGGGNVHTMEEGWRRIWTFLAAPGPQGEPAAISAEQTARLTTDAELQAHAWLPHTRRIIEQMLTDEQVETYRAAGTLAEQLLERARHVGGALRLEDGPLGELHPAQVEALRALAEGEDVLALLPTGYGKSFLFQLPGLILPGVTLVVSPLVSLMTDQALTLNRTVGGRVRALTGTMAESNSRLGKSEVHQQLTGTADHGIKLIYLSPERFASTQFQMMVRAAVRNGIVRRIAFDEAHTLAAWGDTFRPDIRRAELFVRKLRDSSAGQPQLLAVTATATRSVRAHLAKRLFVTDEDALTIVHANPVRADMATYKRLLPARGKAGETQQVLMVEKLLDASDGHAIVYATTIKEVEWIHGILQAQLGRRRRVLKYHSKLDEVEKASVSDFFQTAPRRDDPEGFVPLVVVATKAFGLGIDRPDIRAVVCASPPGDLAELYQALGRAGRDQAGKDPAAATEPTHGIALLTPSAWSTLQFFNRFDRDNERLIARFAAAFRDLPSPLDLDTLINEVIDERVELGEVSPKDAARNRDRLAESYKSLAVRTFAALADQGLLEDLGDAPVLAGVSGPDLPDSGHSPAAAQANAILTCISDEERREGVVLAELFDRLEAEARNGIDDVASLWFELLAFHAVGLLDVTQQPNIGRGSMLNFRRATHWHDDTRLIDELSALHKERAQDLRLLHEWFVNDDDCLLEGIAEYFAVDDWQRGACGFNHTRCSNCWDHPAVADQTTPGMLQALRTDTKELLADAERVAKLGLRRIDTAAEGLLRDYPRGVGTQKLEAALKGEQIVWTGPRPQDLPWGLRRSRHFAQVRSVTTKQLESACRRLEAAGKIQRVTNGRYGWWQHTSHVDTDT